jgi:putative ABC transport system permease protein
VAQLRGSLDKTRLKLEVKPWYELSDFYNKTARLYSSQMGVLYFIIALIVILSITNIMTMNVLERTGEIGTLMAMGTRRRGILGLFVNEGIALGLVGGFSGLLLGLLFAYVISIIGIPMPPAPGMSHGFIAELMVTPSLAAKSVITTFGAVLIASGYPAWKASRLNIVDALRHNK